MIIFLKDGIAVPFKGFSDGAKVFTTYFQCDMNVFIIDFADKTSVYLCLVAFHDLGNF